MALLKKIKIINGVYWVEVPSAELYILCGCPADCVKHLIQKGLIAPKTKNGVFYETGPNTILLSEDQWQSNDISNFSEFLAMHMFYKQGLILPNHPNNTGVKPLIVGKKKFVEAQIQYIFRGNYGLLSEEEFFEAGASPEFTKKNLRFKLKFAFGKFTPVEQLLEGLFLNSKKKELRNGVYVQRKGHNKYEISYENESVIVDLNLPKTESYKIPYQIPKVDIKSKDLGEFSIIHSGSGDGWNPNLPCFGSVVYFREKFYLVDAGPNIEQILIQLGLTFDDIEGIFQTHGHDDHFAGLPSFFHKKKKTKFFATSIVKDSVIKKLDALLSVQKEKSFSECFDFHPLEFDQWNIVEDGLEVKPLLSPHPVETSIFVFQAKNQDGENKNYGHFADIVSFNVLQNMVTDDPEQLGVSQEFFDQVKSEYLEPLSLKKVDIGGGMIHGEAVDFIGDQSDKLILAHTSGDLTPEQAKVGGTASFGSYDVLIQKLAE